MIDPDFSALLDESGFSPPDLEPAPETIIGLWSDLSLAFLNDGWFRFARENDGEPAISDDWQPGRSILDCLPHELYDYYTAVWSRCLNASVTWGHEYQCSSPDRYRLLHEQVYPLGRKEGLLIVHSVIKVGPIKDARTEIDPDRLTDKNGILTLCSHCRKFKVPGERNRWVWAGEILRTGASNVSHGLCDYCRDFFYKGYRGKMTRF